MKKGKTIIIILILAAVAVGIIIYVKKKDEPKQNEVNVVENKITNTVNQVENKVENKANETKTNENKSAESNNSESTQTVAVNATTPSELIVYREGSGESVASDVYTSSLGYTIRYAKDNFKSSFHDNIDWFEDVNQSMNCVTGEKESGKYNDVIKSLSNPEKTTVNGYEAVYVTRRAEGQFEKIFYVNTEKGTYRLTTSCHDNTEYLEGLGKIMDAMVQTFAIK